MKKFKIQNSKFKINNQRGQMAMLATVFIVMVIVPSSAFVVDLGVMQWQRSRAQRAVDSAALSAIKEYIKKSQSDTDYNFASRAKDVAVAFANQNGSDATTGAAMSAYEYMATGAKDTLTIKSGNFNATTKVFSAGTSPYNAVEVGISRSVPLYFGRIFGLTKSSVAVTALARIGPATQGSYPGILPIGVPNSDYNPTELYTIKGINWGSVAPGYKGLLNLDKRWWHCAFYSTTNSAWYSLYDYDGDGRLVSRVDYTGDGAYDSPACNGSNFSYLDIDNDGTQDWNGDASNAMAVQQILNAGEDSDDRHRGVTVVDAGSVPAGCSEPLTQTWKCYVSDGYTGGVAVKSNQRVDIVTGNHTGPFCDAIEEYIANHGDIAITPLVDDFTGQGTNQEVRIVKFAAWQISGCPDNGGPTYNAQFVQTAINGEIDDTGTQSDSDIFAVKLAR